MYGKQQAEVVEEGRHDGCQHNVGVAQAEELCHDEADSAHNRRTELAACGGNGLYCAGKFFFVACALHQRNGYRTRGGHVGDGRAVNHAHKRRGNDGNLSRTAGSLAYERERKVIDKLGEAAVLEEGAEDDEEEDIGRGNADTSAQYALSAPELRGQHTLQRKAVVPEIAGQIFAEPVIGEEDERKNRQIA